MGKVTAIKGRQGYAVEISQFLGADLTNQPSYISPYRSPHCPNIIRQSSGKVCKWIGWHTVKQYEGRINGFHTFSAPEGDRLLIHAGDKLYCEDSVVYEGMADEISVSRQLNGRLIIADGKKLLMYHKDGDTYKCAPVEEGAFVPTIVISRTPQGGGTAYQPINLLGKQRKDSFLTTVADKVYQLSATEIQSVDRVEKMNSDGGWDEVTAYTVDTVTGKVTFSAAIGESPLAGQDNLIITYSKVVDGYADKINSCDIMALYGVNGAMDRIFLAGDRNNPNRDYYCQMDDPTYWGDLWYCTMGQDNSKIMGYSVINDKLATHIDRSDNDTNITLRTGSLLDDGTAIFKQTGSYQGSGAVSKHGFAILETEPLFLTESGIMAVTPSDVLGERYAQLRSYYLNGLLLKQNLKEAVCTTFDRFYMLAAGGYLFALDGTQVAVEKNMPYSNRQYEGFYRLNVPARVLANIDGVLTFGTEDGRVCQFYKDYNSLASFNDDGRPICARWTTAQLYGRSFHAKKRFKQIAIMAGAAVATGVRLSAIYDGTTQLLADYNSDARYLSFGNLAFSKFSFKTDKTSQTFKEKISVKPDNKKAQFVIENDRLNEPLALYETTIEFTESR